MAANPISYAEIEAYSRLMKLRITPFETTLLRHLDMAALASAPKPKKAGEPEVRNAVSPDDVEGVKGLFRGFNARRESQS